MSGEDEDVDEDKSETSKESGGQTATPMEVGEQKETYEEDEREEWVTQSDSEVTLRQINEFII